jgi:hypothetical protein
MLDLTEKTLRYAEKLTDYAEVRFENVKTNRLII